MPAAPRIRRRRGRAVIVAALLTLATACGGQTGIGQDDRSPTRAPATSDAVAQTLAVDCAEVPEPSLPPAPPTGPPTPRPSPEPAVDGPAQVREWAVTRAPSSYAGIWLTADERPQRLVVAFAQVPEGDSIDDIRADAQVELDPVPLVVEVAHTAEELEATREALGTDPLMDRLAAADGPAAGAIIGFGTYDPRNRVAVQLLGDDAGARAGLHERYGDTVCVEISPIHGAGDGQPSPWRPVGVPGPTDTEVAILVNERACASGTSAEGRIEVVEVSYEPDAVVATIGVIPRDGGQNCQGNPDTPFTLVLDEPLGDRDLLDGFVVDAPPPAEPTPRPTPEGPPWTLRVQLEDIDGVHVEGFELQVHVLDAFDHGLAHLDWHGWVAGNHDPATLEDFYDDVLELDVTGPFVEVTSIVRIGSESAQPTCRTAVEEPANGEATLTILFVRTAEGTCALVT